MGWFSICRCSELRILPEHEHTIPPDCLGLMEGRVRVVEGEFPAKGTAAVCVCRLQAYSDRKRETTAASKMEKTYETCQIKSRHLAANLMLS